MQINFFLPLLLLSFSTAPFALKVRQNNNLSQSTTSAAINGTWEIGNHDNYPSNGTIVGYEFGGESVFIGRANYSSMLLFGKYRQALGGVEIGVMNREVVLTHYELLTSINAYWNHTTYTDSSLFQQAVIGSYDSSNVPIYIGRVHYMGGLYPVMVRHKLGHLGYGGRQLIFKTYELLLHPKPVYRLLNFTSNTMPVNATQAFKTSNGTRVYIAQTAYKGNRLIGQYKKGAAHCSFGFATSGFNSTNCDLLTGRNYTWHGDSFGVIPPNAVVGGHTANLEAIYICRGVYNSDWVVGKIRPTFSGCDIAPDGKKQFRVHEYQMLVTK